MAAARTESVPEGHGRIEDVDVSAEMQDSFLEYAYSVIYSRALPDAKAQLTAEIAPATCSTLPSFSPEMQMRPSSVP